MYQSVSRTPSEIPGADVMAAVAMDCQKRLYAEDTRVIDGTQSRTIAEKGIVCLANSKGLDLSQEYGISLVSAVSIVQEPGEEEKYMGYKNSLGEISEIDLADLAKKGVGDALSVMNPGKVDSGKYKIVFSGKMMGAMLSTFASVFSAEACLLYTSPSPRD